MNKTRRTKKATEEPMLTTMREKEEFCRIQAEATKEQAQKLRQWRAKSLERARFMVVMC